MAMNVTVYVIALFVSVLIGILTINTFIALQKNETLEHCKSSDDNFITLTEDKIERLQASIRHRTISYSTEKWTPDELLRFHTFIERGNVININYYR